MTLTKKAQTLLLLLALAVTAPVVTYAKPNSYPGENSKFKTNDPAVIARQKAEREKRIELRKQRREERRRKRQNRRNNRSN